MWIPINDKNGAPKYGDLGKVDAATAAQNAATVTSEDHIDERHADYAGPFGGDNIPDNYDLTTYRGSAAARACSADDGGESGGRATKRELTDGADAGDTTTIASLSPGDGSVCDAEDVEIETSVTFTDGMDLGCEVKRSFTLTCDWDASGGMGTRGSEELVSGGGQQHRRLVGRCRQYQALRKLRS